MKKFIFKDGKGFYGSGTNQTTEGSFFPLADSNVEELIQALDNEKLDKGGYNGTASDLADRIENTNIALIRTITIPENDLTTIDKTSVRNWLNTNGFQKAGHETLRISVGPINYLIVGLNKGIYGNGYDATIHEVHLWEVGSTVWELNEW